MDRRGPRLHPERGTYVFFEGGQSSCYDRIRFAWIPMTSRSPISDKRPARPALRITGVGRMGKAVCGVEAQSHLAETVRPGFAQTPQRHETRSVSLDVDGPNPSCKKRCATSARPMPMGLRIARSRSNHGGFTIPSSIKSPTIATGFHGQTIG